MSLFNEATMERKKAAQSLDRGRLEALVELAKAKRQRKSPVRRGGTRR